MKQFPRLTFLLTLVNIFATACSTGLIIRETPIDATWRNPYVASQPEFEPFKGVENLTFDGEGAMYVSGLNGFIYKVAPTADLFHGTIVAAKKVGKLCLGIVVGPDGFIYIGVEDEHGDNRIAKISKDFATVTFLTTGNTKGLNGLSKGADGFLYFGSSRIFPYFAGGKLFRARIGDDASFAKPELLAEGLGVVNGVVIAPDAKTVYFTETFGSLKRLDLATKAVTKVFTPKGFFTVLDDLTLAPDGSFWVALNSSGCILHLIDGKPEYCAKVGDLKVPSSLRFGSGPGFNPDDLYVSEFGPTRRMLTMKGRGVWSYPTR